MYVPEVCRYLAKEKRQKHKKDRGEEESRGERGREKRKRDTSESRAQLSATQPLIKFIAHIAGR